MTFTIAVLLFEDVAEIDVATPLQIFASIPRGDPPLRVVTAARQAGVLRCWGGLRVFPDFETARMEPPDVLIVPGGPGAVPLAEDSEFLQWLALVGADCRWIAAIGRGAFPVVAAGLASGRCITTHPDNLPALRTLGHAEVVQGVDFLCDGALLSCSGTAAAVEMSLWLVERLQGESAGEAARHAIAPTPTC